jgi:hypothetical protein
MISPSRVRAASMCRSRPQTSVCKICSIAEMGTKRKPVPVAAATRAVVTPAQLAAALRLPAVKSSALYCFQQRMDGEMDHKAKPNELVSSNTRRCTHRWN